MKKFKRIMKDIENAMAAASFAEEGEAAAAREMLKEDRRVLLAIRENQIERRTFRYAINTCKRNGAGLDILYISSSESLHPLLDESLSELQKEGIEFRLIRKHGCLKQQIIDYANATKEIIFAVTESSDNLEVDCAARSGKLSDAWQNLKCPLVVVAENA
jgi:hypothetical protein